MYHKQEYLLLTVNVYSYGLVSILTSIVSLQDPLQCLKSLFRVHSGRLFSYSKKRTITQNDDSLSLVIICCHSLSFDVIRCHSLSLIVPLVVTRCTTRCHSLSFVVTRCHSFSLDVSLCLFINDLYRHNFLDKYSFTCYFIWTTSTEISFRYWGKFFTVMQ